MKKLSAIGIFAVASLMSAQAFALDTTELLDPGVVEAAPAISLDNIHDGKPGFTSEIALGYGVSDFMTVAGIFSASTAEGLAEPSFAFTLEGVFTPVDTEMFDLDFVIDFTYDGGEYSVTPMFEFNLDSDNDMSFWGAYLTLALPITSSVVTENTESKVETDVGLELGLGFYISFVADQALFLEGGFNYANLAENLGEREVEGGYVAVGYNFALFENYELTTEFRIDIPNKDSDEDPTYTLALGGVFDIPTRDTAAE